MENLRLKGLSSREAWGRALEKSIQDKQDPREEKPLSTYNLARDM